jgi:hypothetical protein
MDPDVKHLHLASRDHELSRRFYQTYFGFRFDSTFPRGEQPAATIIRSPTGFQIYLEGASNEHLPAWFHFGFFVESAAACRELHERMQRRGPGRAPRASLLRSASEVVVPVSALLVSRAALLRS